MNEQRCKCCGKIDFSDWTASGDRACSHCGTVLQENNIVSTVQFSESGGSSNVVGQFVSGDKSRASGGGGGGGGGRGRGRFGHSRDSREMTIQNGKRKISQVLCQLQQRASLSEPAGRLFSLCVNQNYVQGRKTINIVAACVYIVCRQNKIAVMLIDISDKIGVNVYVLGKTFQKLMKHLNLQTNVPIVDPALYIKRFANRLGLTKPQIGMVCTTALKIIAAMKRDFLASGRQPSGVCCAALTLATRVNRCERTKEQIRKAVRVCDATVRRRLLEFEQTPTSQLTVEQLNALPANLGTVDEAPFSAAVAAAGGAGGSGNKETGSVMTGEVQMDPPAFIANRIRDGRLKIPHQEQEGKPAGKSGKSKGKGKGTDKGKAKAKATKAISWSKKDESKRRGNKDTRAKNNAKNNAKDGRHHGNGVSEIDVDDDNQGDDDDYNEDEEGDYQVSGGASDGADNGKGKGKGKKRKLSTTAARTPVAAGGKRRRAVAGGEMEAGSANIENNSNSSSSSSKRSGDCTAKRRPRRAAAAAAIVDVAAMVEEEGADSVLDDSYSDDDADDADADDDVDDEGEEEEEEEEEDDDGGEEYDEMEEDDSEEEGDEEEEEDEVVELELKANADSKQGREALTRHVLQIQETDKRRRRNKSKARRNKAEDDMYAALGDMFDQDEEGLNLTKPSWAAASTTVKPTDGENLEAIDGGGAGGGERQRSNGSPVPQAGTRTTTAPKAAAAAADSAAATNNGEANGGGGNSSGVSGAAAAAGASADTAVVIDEEDWGLYIRAEEDYQRTKTDWLQTHKEWIEDQEEKSKLLAEGVIPAPVCKKKKKAGSLRSGGQSFAEVLETEAKNNKSLKIDHAALLRVMNRDGTLKHADEEGDDDGQMEEVFEDNLAMPPSKHGNGKMLNNDTNDTKPQPPPHVLPSSSSKAKIKSKPEATPFRPTLGSSVLPMPRGGLGSGSCSSSGGGASVSQDAKPVAEAAPWAMPMDAPMDSGAEAALAAIFDLKQAVPDIGGSSAGAGAGVGLLGGRKEEVEEEEEDQVEDCGATGVGGGEETVPVGAAGDGGEESGGAGSSEGQTVAEKETAGKKEEEEEDEEEDEEDEDEEEQAYDDYYDDDPYGEEA